MTQTMNNCHTILELVSLHLDGEMDEGQRGHLDRHLATCTDCAAAAAQMRVVDAMFRAAPMRYAPFGFTDRVVTAAFNDDLRRNFGFGFLLLMLGSLVVSGLFVIGRLDLMWTVGSALLAPGLVGTGTVWLGEVWNALAVAGRVSLSALGVLRDLLLGPLLVPALLSLLAALFVPLLSRLGGRGGLRTTA